VVGRAGFEPATFRLSVERSSRAELPARGVRTKLNDMLVNKNFRKLLIRIVYCSVQVGP
jgi:hypothetical protein